MATILLQEEDNSFRNDTVLVPESVTKSYSRSGSVVGSMFSPVGSSWSGLSSPFGSELGNSTETESEEEDDNEFMAELTRQMASYMLEEDDDEKDVQEFGTKKQVSSECTVILTTQHDLQPFVDEQEREIHLYKAENKPSTQTQVKECKEGASKVTKSKKPNKVNRETGILGSGPAVWPPIQSPKQMKYGSGMRAVFLGGPTPKTKTSGTGVFLPRAATNPPEVRKKLGCSTVLIPARVLHTLQLHFEKVKNQTQSNGSVGLKSYPPQYDLKSTQPTQQSQPQSYPTNKTHEICLPQEWTY